LQQLRVQSNELDVHWGQLLIEQSTFGLEGRIERRAMEELNMTFPDWSKIIMVRHE
jgi:cell division protein FtsL